MSCLALTFDMAVCCPVCCPRCASDDESVIEFDGGDRRPAAEAAAESLKFLSLYNPKLFLSDVDSANAGLRRAISRSDFSVGSASQRSGDADATFSSSKHSMCALFYSARRWCTCCLFLAAAPAGFVGLCALCLSLLVHCLKLNRRATGHAVSVSARSGAPRKSTSGLPTRASTASTKTRPQLAARPRTGGPSNPVLRKSASTSLKL